MPSAGNRAAGRDRVSTRVSCCLPKEKRRAMEALYAFMRHTDDLADAGVSPLLWERGRG